jgi:hypothetical protein
MELYYRLEYHHGPNDEAHEYLVIGKTTRNVSGEEQERGYETDIKETGLSEHFPSVYQSDGRIELCLPLVTILLGM